MWYKYQLRIFQKSVIRFVDREYLESVISKCNSLSLSDVEQLMKIFEDSEFAQFPIQFYVKTLTGECIDWLNFNLENINYSAP